MKNKTILVAWDFSENSRHALSHAQFYSFQTKFRIYLLHVVKDKSKVEDTKLRLDETARAILKEEGCLVDTTVRVGYMSDGLRSAAEELNSVIIFGGLPGTIGLQKFIGRYIMNAILGSVIPSIVVQKPKLKTDVLSIVCPIDHKKECKAGLDWIQQISTSCKTKIYLTHPKCNYSPKTQMVKSNMIFAKNYLRRYNIEFEEQELSSQSFKLNMLNFAESKKAELILNITNKESKIKNILIEPDSHRLLANQKQIPVVSIRPKEGLWKYGGFN